METSFYDLVYEMVRLVPKGRVTSYGAIAKALGAAKSSRMVGHAMAFAGLAEKYVPAHRVVNAQGLLTGRFHFNPPEEMERLLEAEGIQIKNHKVQQFKAVFWDPLLEIN